MIDNIPESPDAPDTLLAHLKDQRKTVGGVVNLLAILASLLVLVFLVGGAIRHLMNADEKTDLSAAALAAFAIVFVLNTIFPPEKDATTGALTVKIFNLEFSGPAGPVLLWVVCFLAFVFGHRFMYGTSIEKRPARPSVVQRGGDG
jgi:hypothetical protein